jgi:hypothetical protein
LLSFDAPAASAAAAAGAAAAAFFSPFIRHGFLGGNHKPSLKSNSEHFTAFIIVQRGLGEGDLGGNSKKKSYIFW